MTILFTDATSLSAARPIIACLIPMAFLLGGCASDESLNPEPTSSSCAAAPTRAGLPCGSDGPVTKGELEPLLHVRFLFGHQSIGMSLLDATPAIFEGVGLVPPKVANTEWPEVRDTTTDPVFAQAWIGANGNPIGKIVDFAAQFDKPNGNTYDIALMKLGAADFSSSSDVVEVFDTYTSTMERLERAHQNTIFLYSTATLTTEGDDWTSIDESQLGNLAEPGTDNALREKYNDMIRERYASSGRLFDIADLEAQIGHGQVSAQAQDGMYYRVMNPKLSSDGLHLTTAGAEEIATSLMRLLARAIVQRTATR